MMKIYSLLVWGALIFVIGCNPLVGKNAKSSFQNSHNPLLEIPGPFSITSANENSGVAEISWSASSKANFYQVSYRLISVSTFTEVSPTISAPNTTFNLTGLSNGTYVIKVKAFNNKGSSQTSTVQVVIPLSGTAPVSYNISPLAFDEDALSGFITLNYDTVPLADQCEIVDENFVTAGACACDGIGICQVRVTGFLNHFGILASFTYKVRANSLWSNISTASLTILPMPDAPTLTTVATLTGGTENTTYTITYSDLAAAANEDDVDGDTVSFRVESVTSGTLTKAGIAVVNESTTLGPTESLVWTPAVDENGLAVNAFTIKAYDGVYVSTSPVQVKVNLAALNSAPTLTNINTGLSGNKNEHNTILFSALLALSDLADVDGPTPLKFSIQSVTTTGILKLNGVTVSAFPVTFSNTDTLTWKPPLHFHGSMTAFTVKGFDGTLTSATAKDVPVNVINVNHAPTLTSIATLTAATEDLNYTIDYDNLTSSAVDFADPDGDTLSFKITEAITNGTLKRGAVVLGVNDVIETTDHTLVWLPNLNLNGTINAFKVKANDGSMSSDTSIQVKITTAPINDLPTLSTIEDLGPIFEDFSLSMSFTSFREETNILDPDQYDSGYTDTRRFKINSITSGVLLINGAPAVAGDFFSATQTLNWTPPAYTHGTLNAFTVVADDTVGSSVAPIQVKVLVNHTNHAPLLTSISNFTVTEDIPFDFDFADLQGNATGFSDPDAGDTLTFKITGIIAGTLKKGLIVLATNDVISSGDNLTWYPPTNADTTIAAFTVRAFDGLAVSATEATVSMAITPVNDIPIITSINQLSGAVNDEDFTINYNDILASVVGYVDPDGPAYKFRLISPTEGVDLTKSGVSVTWGTTTFESGEFIVWTPPPGVWGVKNAFKVKIDDGLGLSIGEYQVTVNISLFNHTPTLTSVNNFTVVEDNDLSIPFANLVASSVGFADIDVADTLRFKITGLVTGSLSLNGSPATPPFEFSAGDVLIWHPSPEHTTGLKDAFYVAAFDGEHQSLPVLVKVNVTPVNDAPTLSTIADVSLAEDSATSITFLSFKTSSDVNDVDTSWGDLNFKITSITAGWTLSKSVGDFFSATETLTITPPAGTHGNDVVGFKVMAYDGALYSAEVSIKFDIEHVNHRPTIATTASLPGAGMINAVEDTTYDMTFAQLMTATGAADVDVGDVLQLCVTEVSSAHTLTVVGGAAIAVNTCLVAGQTIRWRGPADANGTLNIMKVKAYDAQLLNAYSLVESQITAVTTAVNDEPTLSPLLATFEGYEDVTVTIHYADLATLLNLSDVDLPADTLSFQIVGVTAGWTSSIALNSYFTTGDLTLTPPLHTNGLLNAIIVKAYDGALNSVATAQIKINVGHVNHPPTLSTIAVLESTNEDQEFNITYAALAAAADEADVDSGDVLSFKVGSVTTGTLRKAGSIVEADASIAAGESFDWTPATNANGVALNAFTVRVDDSFGSSSNVQVRVKVDAVNDTPTMTAIAAQSTTEDTDTSAISVIINDIDSTLVCGSSLSMTSSDTSKVINSAVVWGGTAPNCTAVITPVANANGVTNITFTATDGSLTTSRTFALTISADNDAPTMTAIAAQSTSEDTDSSAINVTINDTDSTLDCSTSLSMSSSNTAKVINSAVVWGGTAPNCTAVITPVANANGVTNITFTATDGSLTTSRTFVLTITPVNDAPTMAAISGQTTTANIATSAIAITVNDIDNSLVCGSSLSMTSSDTSKVINSAVAWGGTAPNCTAVITPVTNATGITNITFTATDGSLTASRTFALTISPPIPGIPSGVAAVAGTSSIVISWTDGSWEDDYTVLRSPDNIIFTPLLACSAVPGSAPTCNDTTAVNGTQYYYAVRANNTSGSSANSSSVTGKAIASFAITSITIPTSSGASKLQVNWTAPAGGETYNISWGTGGSPTGTGTGTGTSPFLISGLAAGTYTVRVTANNSIGDGNSVHGTTATGTPMSAFALTSATGGNAQVTLEWETSTGADVTYTVKYRHTDTPAPGYTTTILTSSPAIITGLLNNNTYYFMVTADNTNGTLDATAELSAIPSSSFWTEWDFSGTGSPEYVWSPDLITVGGGFAKLFGPDQIDGDTATDFDEPAATATGLKWNGDNIVLENNNDCDGRTSDCAPGSPEIESLGITTPIAYFKMNNSWEDAIGLLSDAAPTDATFTTDKRITGTHAANFASGNYLTLPGGFTNTIKNNNAHTISIWFYPQNDADIMTLLNAPSTQYMLQIKSRSTAPANLTDPFDEIRWTVGAVTRTYGLRTTQAAASKGYVKILRNKWNHIAIVKTATTTSNVYLNGSMLTYTNDTVDPWINFVSTPNVNSDFEIGRNGASQYFQGQIDEIAIWNSILSPNEIDRIYERQVRSPKSGVLLSRVMDASSPKAWNSLTWMTTFPFGKPIAYSADETSTDYPDLDTNFKTSLLTYIPFNSTLGTLAQGDTLPAYGADTAAVTVTTKTADSNLSIGEGKIGRGLRFGTATVNSAAAIVSKSLDGESLQNLTLSVWFKLGDRPASDSSVLESSRVILQWMTPASVANRPFHVAVNTRKGNVGLHIAGGGGTATTALLGSTTFQPEPQVWNNLIFTAEKVATNIIWKCYYNGIYSGSYTFTGSEVFGAAGLYAKTLSIGSGNNLITGGAGAYKGSIDEVAIWNRTMTEAEAKKLYRRSASRIKFQVRTCANNECNDATWKGPDGTASTFFSEFHNVVTQGVNPTGNVLSGSPSIDVTKFNLGVDFPTGGLVNNQYFQYRTILESDSTIAADYPKLTKVEIGPAHYDTTSPYIVGTVGTTGTVASLVELQEVLGANGCGSPSSLVTYNLGIGANSGAATWYWWNAATPAWEPASGAPAQSNLRAVVETRMPDFIPTFPVGANKLFFKAFLNSPGSTPCELSNVKIKATH